MKHRFLIAGKLDADAEKSLVDIFRSRGIWWWHRIPNFWLLIDSSDDPITAEELRNKIREIRKNVGETLLVMEITEDVTWHGLMATSKKDTFDWLKTTWEGD